MQCKKSFIRLQIETGIVTDITTLIAVEISIENKIINISHFRMVFDTKRTVDAIPWDEGVARCLMRRITVAGYKVFKVSNLH